MHIQILFFLEKTPKLGEEKPNILLLTIDCLRADHLGCMGYERQTTPFLDELAKKGVLFKSAYTNGPGTRFAFKSIFCSVYPTQIKGLGLPSDGLPTLAELLKSEGYSTAGFHTNGYLSSGFNYDRGFDFFYDLDLWKSSLSDRVSTESRRLLRDMKKRLPRIVRRGLRKVTPHARAPRISLWRDSEFLYRGLFADELTEKAIKWMEKQNGPIFVWIHFMDVHHPYLVRHDYSLKIRHNSLRYLTEGRFTENELGELIGLYDDQVRKVDVSIKKFLDRFSEFNGRETLLIITSDHGEEFMEHGGFHNVSPYQEMIHVPLIVVGEGVSEGVEVNTPVSLVDLLPTVTDIIGHQTEHWIEGKSLLSCLREEANREYTVFINYYCKRNEEVRLILDNEKKLIFKVGPGTWEFYDLVSDPFEKNNIFSEEDIVQKEVKRKMEEKNYAVKSRGYIAGEAEASKHVVDQLKALGYLD